MNAAAREPPDRRRSAGAIRRRTLGLLLLVVLLAPLAVDALILTDEEAIQALVDRAVDAVEQRDAASLAGMLSDSFEDSSRTLRGLARDGAEKAIQAALEPLDSVEIDVDRRDVTVEGDRATLEFSAQVMARIQGFGGRGIPLRIEMTLGLERVEECEWRFDHLERLSTRTGL